MSAFNLTPEQRRALEANAGLTPSATPSALPAQGPSASLLTPEQAAALQNATVPTAEDLAAPLQPVRPPPGWGEPAREDMIVGAAPLTTGALAYADRAVAESSERSPEEKRQLRDAILPGRDYPTSPAGTGVGGVGIGGVGGVGNRPMQVPPEYADGFNLPRNREELEAEWARIEQQVRDGTLTEEEGEARINYLARTIPGERNTIRGVAGRIMAEGEQFDADQQARQLAGEQRRLGEAGEANRLREQASRELDVADQMAQIERAAYQDERDQQMDRFRKAMDRAAEFEVDPGRYTSSQDWWQTLSTTIGLMLGGALQGMGGPNPAAEMLEKRIDEDIRAQEAKLEGLSAAAAREENMLGVMRAQFADEEQARAAAKQAMLDRIQREVNAIAQRSGMADMQDQADSLAAQIDLRARTAEDRRLLSGLQQRQQQLLAMRPVGGGGGGRGSSGKSPVNQKERQEWRNVDENLSQIEGQIRSLDNWDRASAIAADILATDEPGLRRFLSQNIATDAVQEVDTQQKSVMSIIGAMQQAGALNEGEAERYRQMVGGSVADPEAALARIRGVRRTLASLQQSAALKDQQTEIEGRTRQRVGQLEAQGGEAPAVPRRTWQDDLRDAIQ